MRNLETYEDLTAAVRAGDSLAFQALLQACRRRVLAYAERQLPAELRAVIGPEDVAQDTAAEAFRRMAEIPDAGGEVVVRWLLTIARHRMINMLHAHRAAKRGGGRARLVAAAPDGGGDGLVPLLESLAVYDRTPSTSAAAHELAAAVQRSIDQLLPDQRDAVRLRHIDGLSARDAAERMGRTEPAFHQLCYRGLNELRVALRSESIYV